MAAGPRCGCDRRYPRQNEPGAAGRSGGIRARQLHGHSARRVGRQKVAVILASGQQMRGSCSPLSMSTARSTPNRPRHDTSPDGPSRTSPITAAVAATAYRWKISTVRPASSGATKATNRPSFATCNGSRPNNSQAARPPRAPGSQPHQARSRALPSQRFRPPRSPALRGSDRVGTVPRPRPR